MWRIGSEVPEQRRADGWKEDKRLVSFFHEEDPTRPTTSAFNTPQDAIANALAKSGQAGKVQMTASAESLSPGKAEIAAAR